ncbi:16564_t:CDS:2 [Racocetra fulgida]|uniref:16564_t:CDS:1 n=1 Tax=Racocetra fulgida TaxID=60492 RepID=A0A9N9FBU8_9GLOM|nr:16564_t:CDS:2 [Racocetra fulgida]
MLPPSPGKFKSHEELLTHVRTFAKTQGYAVTIKRSRSGSNGEIKNMNLKCDRGGVYRNRLNLTDDSRCRQTASRLLSCQFELFAIKHDNFWILEIVEPGYNHEASDMLGHLIIQRLNTKQREQVQRIN